LAKVGPFSTKFKFNLRDYTWQSERCGSEQANEVRPRAIVAASSLFFDFPRFFLTFRLHSTRLVATLRIFF
jgi:hypothetical protein